MNQIMTSLDRKILKRRNDKLYYSLYEVTTVSA